MSSQSPQSQSQYSPARHAPGQASLDIPDLRILSLDSLLLHEHADEKRVAKLAARLQTDGFLKNPPIVAPIQGTDRYVVLDGANRTSAVRQIGCLHILAQVVDYESDAVKLQTWYHLITGREPSMFLAEITGIEGLVLKNVTLEEARQTIKHRSIIGYIVLPSAGPDSGSAIYTVDVMPSAEPDGGSDRSTTLLNAMVSTYKGDPEVGIHRVNTDQLENLMSYYDRVSGLIVFPPYKPADIIRLAETGARVPTGITRHIISHRALRINVPVSVLCSDESLEEKNRWWHEQVKRKLEANEIRFYQESTFLFDE